MVMLDFIYIGSADRNGEGAKHSKWKYMYPVGFEPTPRQSTTGKSAPKTARPRWLDIEWIIYSLTVDMWQYLYGIGYGLIPNAKFCKQLLY